MTDHAPLISEGVGAPGLAYSHAVPQPGMRKDHYKADAPRFQAAWHAAHCRVTDCEWCQNLCDDGFIIACDDCGHVHHTDWLGWCGFEVDGRCTVLCPECWAKTETTDQNNLPTIYVSANISSSFGEVDAR